jgi:TolB-like protein
MQQLRAIPGVYVIEPSIAAAYAESELPPEQIAMYLGVRGIVQGRVIASGNTVNFSLRFTDAAGDGTAIDTRFAAAAGQIAQLENAITASLLDALTIRRPNTLDLSL